MKEGWYKGLSSRFSDHYYLVISKTDVKTRCGQVTMTMLSDQYTDELKLFVPKNKQNLCGSCINLIDQDKYKQEFEEPHRY